MVTHPGADDGGDRGAVVDGVPGGDRLVGGGDSGDRGAVVDGVPGDGAGKGSGEERGGKLHVEVEVWEADGERRSTGSVMLREPWI